MICSKSGTDTKASHPRRHNGSSNCLRGTVSVRYCFRPLLKTIDTREHINTTPGRRVWSNEIDVNVVKPSILSDESAKGYSGM